MQEEGRHILFFVNWVAWHKRNLSWPRRPLFAVKVLAVWILLVWERIGIARGVGNGGDGSGAVAQDNNFTLTGSKAVGAVDLSVAALIDVDETHDIGEDAERVLHIRVVEAEAAVQDDERRPASLFVVEEPDAARRDLSHRRVSS